MTDLTKAAREARAECGRSMSKPDLNRYGIPRVRCVNCGRPITWWLGVRWKHTAGGGKPQPKCAGPKPAPVAKAAGSAA